jgi:integration host factor subunit alpha|tara:strand:+ start:6185 stop:6460 length:276 start_codon:yes stop_codon:yes gene_type:complete
VSLGKKDIIKNISSKAHFSYKTSKKILDKFIESIRSNSKKNSVKIAKFGTFYTHSSPIRYGRNPKTMEEFLIPERTKLSLKVSQNVKNLLN